MTLLERLATSKNQLLTELAERRRAETDTPTGGIDVVDWNNKSSWDNWNQKTPKWKKKRVYFTKKN